MDNSQGLKLKRKVGLLSGICLIVGNMIGSGIFINPGYVLQSCGSVGSALVVWAACGLLSIFGALSYAELGTLIPKSGGEYSYFMDGLGCLHRFWGPLPAFLYSWVSVLLMNPASIAVGCLSCAGYTIHPILAALGQCPTADHQLLVKLTALVYLGLIMALNCYSVDWTIRAHNVLTAAKLVAIVLVIGCGIHQISIGRTQYLAQGFQGSTKDFGQVAMAFYGGLWSYYGWNALNYITEELKDPYVNLPRAIVLGLSLVTCLYLAVNVAYLSVLSPEELIHSEAVAVDFGNYLLGPFAFVIPLAVAMSTFGGVLSSAFVTGRLCFASAREGHMIDVLSFVHVDSRTPFPALIFTGGLSFIMIVSNDVTTLIDFFSFTVWIFIVLAMVLLLILRKTRPDANRPYRVPLAIPVVTAIVGCYLVVAPLVSDPTIEYLWVLGALGLGFLTYIPFVYYKYSLGCIGSVTRIIQLMLQVGPTAKPAFD